ncbi:MAG: linoleoyl-CoA desaturase [Patescibacteria group bacterium]|nr:linoleoyl-CoA desaturase [Patescibacteria group bacterium]
MKSVSFQSSGDNILKDIRKATESYFKENNLKKTGNTSLYVKSIFMAALLIVPFTLTWSFQMNIYLLCLLAFFSGLGMAGVGMNIMHDANHGTYHRKPRVNKLVGHSTFLIAANSFNWINQHNDAHHTNTNIDGHDNDIESDGIFRFTKEQEWRWYHKYQVFYAIFLYSMTTLMRAVLWDFTRMAKYFRDHPEVSASKKKKEWTILISLRALYFFFWIGVPILFGQSHWYFAIVFFLVMHLVCGLVLTLIFQTAHVVPPAKTYSSDEEKESWAMHQLLTTCNFATDSPLASWLLGGLNFQIVHHLMPDVSHVHYPKISWIVRNYCYEKKIVYLEYMSTWDAIWAHFVHLYILGKKPI